MAKTHGSSLPSQRGLCVPCPFLRLYPYFTTSTVGELGRGLSRCQALLLELSYELRKQERREEPGRQRVGVSRGKKKGEKEEGKASAKRQLERHQENVEAAASGKQTGGYI